MLAQFAGLAIFALMLLPAALGGYYWWTAIEQARPWLPVQLQEYQTASGALYALIWTGTFPDSVRRNFLLSQIFGCIFLAFMTLFVVGTFINGTLPLLAVLLFGAITAYSIVFTVRFWLRYRRRAASRA